MSSSPTKRASYLRKWQACRQCPLHLTARHHAILRGSIPANILFVGEAPGPVEDQLGKPFVGPSGRLLTDAIRRLNIISYAITNIVCCIPKDTPDSHFREPSVTEAAACRPHLTELLALTHPKLVISLGEVAKRHLAPLLKTLPTGCRSAHLRHPAYVLRKGGRDSLEHKKFIYGLQLACTEAGIHITPYFNVLLS